MFYKKDAADNLGEAEEEEEEGQEGAGVIV